LRESGGPSGSLSGLPFRIALRELIDVNEHHFVGKRDSDLLSENGSCSRAVANTLPQRYNGTNIRILNLDYNLDLAIYDERGIDIGERRITTGQFIAIESNLSAFFRHMPASSKTACWDIRWTAGPRLRLYVVNISRLTRKPSFR